ncbi:MAG: OmpH family outer membrane protein [Desulfomicrobium sp.]|jgi:outer membrane protein|nr:OmpH family outer membrane protein [Desulfomicrobium sp.]NLV96618.1 OmpH family outer membrane protein [Desulfovibrionales bacterium]
MRLRIFSIMVLLLFVATTVSANTKIAIVDMKAVIAQSEAGIKAMDQLKTQFKDMKDNLDAQKKSLDTLKDELQKQSMMLSQEAKMDKEDQYKRKIRDFQDMGQNYQRKLQQAEQDLSKPIIDKLVQVVDDYGKKNSYDIIFDAPTSGVIFAQDHVDVTQAIITELNKVMRGK